MLILEIASIIILSKLFSDLATRVKQPPVLGMLILGLLLGPSCFHIIEHNEVINIFSEIGVLILLFMVGLETDINRKQGRMAFVIALNGVILPFALGFLSGVIFQRNIAQSMILGAILTATSVSVTVMTLVDIGKLISPEGKLIVTAAIIDDVIGIIVLTIVLSLAGSNTSPFITIIKMVGFFGIAYLLGLIFLYGFRWVERIQAREAVLATAFAMMLIYAYLADNLGVASITGAYIAGVVLRKTKYRKTILSGMDILGHSLFINFFFVDIGLRANLGMITKSYLFLIVLILFAIFGKIGGSYAGTTILRLKPKRGLRIGMGMIPRGEVALAISSMALSRGIINRGDFSSIVVMTIISALITPVLLKLSFREKRPGE